MVLHSYDFPSSRTKFFYQIIIKPNSSHKEKLKMDVHQNIRYTPEIINTIKKVLKSHHEIVYQ